MKIEDYSKGDKICAMRECNKKAIYKITTMNYSLFYLCDDCYKNMMSTVTSNSVDAALRDI